MCHLNFRPTSSPCCVEYNCISAKNDYKNYCRWRFHYNSRDRLFKNCPFQNSYFALDKYGKHLYRGRNFDNITAQPLSAYIRQLGISQTIQDSLSLLYPGLEWDFAYFHSETFHVAQNQLYFHFTYALEYKGDEWGKKHIILVFRMPITENEPLTWAELLFSFTDNRTTWQLKNICSNVFMAEPIPLVDYQGDHPTLSYLFTYDELIRDSLYAAFDSTMAHSNKVYIRKEYLNSSSNYLMYTDLSPFGFQKASYFSTGYEWLNLSYKSELCEAPDNYFILSPLFLYDNEPHYLAQYFIQGGARKTDLALGDYKCICVHDSRLTTMD